MSFQLYSFYGLELEVKSVDRITSSLYFLFWFDFKSIQSLQKKDFSDETLSFLLNRYMRCMVEFEMVGRKFTFN